MDEYERYIQIQKINQYFESKRINKLYDPYKKRRTRTKKKDMQNKEWSDFKRKQYSKEYYQLNKEKLKEYAKRQYQAKKPLLNIK